MHRAGGGDGKNVWDWHRVLGCALALRSRHEPWVIHRCGHAKRVGERTECARRVALGAAATVFAMAGGKVASEISVAVGWGVE